MKQRYKKYEVRAHVYDAQYQVVEIAGVSIENRFYNFDNNFFTPGRYPGTKIYIMSPEDISMYDGIRFSTYNKEDMCIIREPVNINTQYLRIYISEQHPLFNIDWIHQFTTLVKSHTPFVKQFYKILQKDLEERGIL